MEPRTLCKFWLSGKCEKGNECIWLHDEDAGGMEPQPCKFWLQGTCKNGDRCTWPHDDLGSSHKGKGKGKEKGKGMDKGKGKGTMCRFFERGLCQKGNACEWSHGPAKWTPAFSSSPAPAASVPQEGMVVMRTLCRHFQDGNCKNGDLCTYAHGEDEIGALAPATPQAAAAIKNSGYSPYPTGGGKGKMALGDSYGLGKGLTKGKQGKSSFGFLGGSGKGGSGKGGGKTTCKFWLEGSCTRGSQCTWAHD